MYRNIYNWEKWHIEEKMVDILSILEICKYYMEL